MNLLVAIIILHAENRFLSLACISLSWQAVLSVGQLCFTLPSRDLVPSVLFSIPYGVILVCGDESESPPPHSHSRLWKKGKNKLKAAAF